MQSKFLKTSLNNKKLTGPFSRNYFLDNFRFIAATLVVLFHFSVTSYSVDNPYRSFVKFGYLGVPIFFVISGYCIALSAQNNHSPLNFLIRRLFRVYPPYWFSLAIIIGIAITQKIITGHNSVTVVPKTFLDIFQTLVLYTAPLSEVPTMNLIYWSLSCEVGFYVLVFLGMMISRNNLVYYLIFLTITTAFVEIPTTGILYIFKQWPTFMLGTSIFYISKNLKKRESIQGFILLMTSIVILIYRFNEHADIPYIFVALLSTLLIFTSIFFDSKPNLFSRLGDYSYSIYLLHIPIGWYLLGHLRIRQIHTFMLYHIIFDLIAYIIIIFLSKYTYIFIEQPSIELGKKIAKKLSLISNKLKRVS